MAGKSEYKNKWQIENCDRVNLTVKKGAKNIIKNIAAAGNDSINGYIKKAIKSQIKNDTGNDIDL